MSDDAVTDTAENDELQGEEREPVTDEIDEEEVQLQATNIPDPGPVEDDEGAP